MMRVYVYEKKIQTTLIDSDEVYFRFVVGRLKTKQPRTKIK